MTIKEQVIQELESMTDGQLAAALTLIQGLKTELTLVPNPISNLIIHSPETCGDRPRLVGTRITVGRIATLWKQGLTPEEIADNWGYISMTQIYTALAYYHANREEIDQQLTQDQADYDRLYAEQLALSELAP